MPIIDMPLEELKTYQGCNPKPADFDAYWDRALKEMRGTDPQVELVPVDFPQKAADCFDLWFTGVGGARIHGKLVKPKNLSGPAPAVLLFHGYSMSCYDWYEYLGYAANGFVVAGLDCRGQGGKSEDVGGVKGTTLNGHIIRGLDDDPDNLLFRQIFLDTAELANIVMEMPEVDPTRVTCNGGSQGGALTLACAALEPRIRRAAPSYPFLCDYKRVWDMDLDVAAYNELRSWFRFHDPLHKRETEIFTKLGYIDCQHLAPRIKAEILMATGLMDSICPPSSQFAAYNKIQSKKEVVIYPDYGHEGLPSWSDTVFQFLSEV